MVVKRTPQRTPGPAHQPSQPGDDFTLPAALYYDAVHHLHSAQVANRSCRAQDCDRFKRSALLAAFSCLEAQLNQVAFAHAAAHRETLGQVELDVLEEMETVIDERGDVVRKAKFYRAEARLLFIGQFLSGKRFDQSGRLWQRFRAARELRDRWTHPKPPFDTWSLQLADVAKAIAVTRELLLELSSMMGCNAPLWLKPVDDILKQLRADVAGSG